MYKCSRWNLRCSTILLAGKMYKGSRWNPREDGMYFHHNPWTSPRFHLLCLYIPSSLGFHLLHLYIPSSLGFHLLPLYILPANRIVEHLRFHLLHFTFYTPPESLNISKILSTMLILSRISFTTLIHSIFSKSSFTMLIHPILSRISSTTLIHFTLHQNPWTSPRFYLLCLYSLGFHLLHLYILHSTRILEHLQDFIYYAYTL